MLEVADNTGARKLQMILPLGGDRPARRPGRRDHRRVKEAAPDGQVQEGQGGEGVIVRTRKETPPRRNLHPLRSNAAVLINEVGEPVGTRVFGPVARELREKKFLKIVSLAPEVL